MKKAIKGFALLVFVAVGTLVPFKKSSAQIYSGCSYNCTPNINYDCNIHYSNGASQYCTYYGPKAPPPAAN